MEELSYGHLCAHRLNRGKQLHSKVMRRRNIWNSLRVQRDWVLNPDVRDLWPALLAVGPYSVALSGNRDLWWSSDENSNKIIAGYASEGIASLSIVIRESCILFELFSIDLWSSLSDLGKPHIIVVPTPWSLSPHNDVDRGALKVYLSARKTCLSSFDQWFFSVCSLVNVLSSFSWPGPEV